MPIDRSLGRNVHFYDASVPDVSLGGLIQNGSVTEANFLDMLSIILVTNTPIRVQGRTSGHIVTRTNSRVESGEYDIYCDNPIQVNNEPWVHRINSFNVSGREEGFREGIRARDGRCVVSGVDYRHGRRITDMDDTNGVSKINSLQNGFMLRRDIHGDFDQYLLSVNPDDNYKIVVFDEDLLGIDGRMLDPVCRNPEDPHPVCDALLRWHFRQSVLANMRGAGEPVFEHDFPPGTDMMREIREGPCAQERFELELAARLGVAI
ncbi:uncharacterized protein LAJ45_08037 [Morchella importuna]|uniref:uncharacterized protein n=1 Tax=Morchella importuna TaxID=1174673 RepID=UPI001E8DA063|nr:uncharacterized protein LAJ45_08037 [Morchella importuna]KAH8147936.1 hypothetical protein LAJ45_08037 [Morchella importuna]